MKPLPRNAQTWINGLAICLLVLLAAWLRLRGLGYTEMWEDQSQEIGGVLDWLNGGPLPLAAMKSSFGVFNPPLVRYVYALPLWLTRDILSVVWLTTIVNLVGLAAAGVAVGRVFGWRVAWWSTALYLVNPWAVYYAHLIWMQTLVPGFAGLLFACTLLYFAERPRPAYIVVGALALAATIQVHLSSVILIGVLAVLALLLPQPWPVKPLTAGVVLFGLSFLPYLAFQVQTHWVDLTSLRDGLGQPAQLNGAAALILLDLIQSKGVYATAGLAGDRWRALDSAGPIVDAVVAGLLGLALLAALVRVGQGAREAGARRAWPASVRGRWVLIVWLVLPVVAFLRHTHYLQNYYFLYEFPVPLVLMALLAEELYAGVQARLSQAGAGRARWAWAAGVVFLPLGLIGAQQAWTSARGLDLLVQGAAGKQRVLDVRRAIASATRLLAERPDCEVVVVSDGATPQESRFGLLREYLAPRDVRFMPAGVGYLAPAPCALYFAPAADPASLAWLTANAQPLPDETIYTPEQAWTFFDLPAAARAALAKRWLATGTPLAAWENGLQLLSAEHSGRAAATGDLTLTATWRVTSDRPQPPTHFGNYLLTQTNTLVAQADGAGLESEDWHAGDLFQTVFRLTIPTDLTPGDYQLAIALYLYPEIRRIPLATMPGDLVVVGQATLP